MSDFSDLQNRRILVTGATGHLGFAIARQLCAAGAVVILNGRDEARITMTAARLSRQGGTIIPAPFDLTQAEEISRGWTQIEQEMTRLDGIVHAAYAEPVGEASEGLARKFQRAYELAVTAPAVLTQKALPLLRKGAKTRKGGASIVHVGSMYGWVSPNPEIYVSGQAGNPPYYGAAKAALHQLTRHEAAHLADEGIRVNTVSPGPFPSPATLRKNAGFEERLAGKCPLKRIGQPDEIAGPVLFLLSSTSSYITGINLPVDGGWTAW